LAVDVEPEMEKGEEGEDDYTQQGERAQTKNKRKPRQDGNFEKRTDKKKTKGRAAPLSCTVAIKIQR
jgi:hypothetical protein